MNNMTPALKKDRVEKKKVSLPYTGTVFDVARYFGFESIPPLTIGKKDIEDAKKSLESDSDQGDPKRSICPPLIRAEEKVALLSYYEKNLSSLPQPVLLYHERKGRAKKKSRERDIFLDVIGTSQSIAEAIVIKTALSALDECGVKNLSVVMNSIGDRDSFNRFFKDLVAYYKKHGSELHTECRDLLHKNPHSLFLCENEKCRILRNESPKPMNYLSEPSRAHFKEVLEYLEFLGIPYDIDPYLLGPKGVTSHTSFEIWSEVDGKKQAYGSGIRWNTVARRLGGKKEIPAIGAILRLNIDETRAIKMKQPEIAFLQIGTSAKLKSLTVIDTLRKAKIPVYQMLARDRLTSQLSVAENRGIPYLMIMGQKEAVENSVIVRNLADRFQDTVPMNELPSYLKKRLGK